MECKFFANGSCKHGDSCRFKHNNPPIIIFKNKNYNKKIDKTINSMVFQSSRPNNDNIIDQEFYDRQDKTTEKAGFWSRLASTFGNASRNKTKPKLNQNQSALSSVNETDTVMYQNLSAFTEAAKNETDTVLYQNLSAFTQAAKTEADTVLNQNQSKTSSVAINETDTEVHQNLLAFTPAAKEETDEKLYLNLSSFSLTETRNESNNEQELSPTREINKPLISFSPSTLERKKQQQQQQESYPPVISKEDYYGIIPQTSMDILIASLTTDYTPMHLLSDQDRKNFEADKFTYPIPICPPPKELCFGTYLQTH